MSDGKRPEAEIDSTRIGLCQQKINKHDNCTYLKGKIGNLTISFLIDSGSNTTLLSNETYCQLDDTYRPHLRPTEVTLRAVNKDELKVYGVADFTLQFENQKYLQQIMVCGPLQYLAKTFS